MYAKTKTDPPTAGAVRVSEGNFMRILFVLAVLFIGLVIFPLPPAFGVVVGSTDTSEFFEPTSPWNGMNWDYVYSTGAGTSVAVDSWHLLSPGHYSLGIGATFTAGSETFEVTGYELPPVDTGESLRPDLKIIEVKNNTNPGIPLPGFYELYGGSFTLGQDGIMVGTGYTGTDYGTSYSDDTSSARVKRWGTNEVERFRLGTNTTGRKVVSSWSTMTFRMDYSSYDMTNEAGLADHDSGGGVFVLDGGVWKLAGLGLYRTETSIGSGRYDENYMASIPDYDDWILGFTPEFILGDANRDGVVSAGDYAAVQANFGNAGVEGFLVGDANGDGIVSAGDYACIQANFGNSAPASSAISTPEPMTLSLLSLGGLALLKRKRK